MSMYLFICVGTHVYMYICTYMSHKGVFKTIKSFVHALGTSSSITEPTLNSGFQTFIEQVINYNLQKMVQQFATAFCTHSGSYLYGLYPT